MPSYLRALTLAAFLLVVRVSSAADPTVVLNNATFTGITKGGASHFLGIPFAKPPTGNLRFRRPAAVAPYSGAHRAQSFGPACPQQGKASKPSNNLDALPQEEVDYIDNVIYGSDALPQSEDCLTINVVKPENATLDSKLPVLVWIFGGGFQVGSTSTYDGGTIVARSLVMNNPVIFVSMNHRLSGFGFMAGKEVKDAGVGNLGLHDQQEALRWVQKYISNFGGDPTKVTIWGESSGAISVALHMVAYGGNARGLFRAAVMQSGAPIPVGDITNGQEYYDFVVTDTGCSGSPDTLQCLRTVPYARLKASIDKTPSITSYQALHLTWLPRTDGVMFSDNPQKLVQQGKVARVPYITGNCDDEGTAFSLSTLNITQTVFLPGVTDAEVARIIQEYPQDVAKGSPFDTGTKNAITPQYKRIAAFQGDGVFQGPRRWMLNSTAERQNAWVFLSKRYKNLPVLGSAHGHDLLNSWGGGELQTYIIRFTNVLDPNALLLPNWPRYRLNNRQIMTFMGTIPRQKITTDDYRASAMNYLNEVVLRHPV
ncbi:carotenoid ester lipase precursor [Coprinopsis marcescibilis]|uniref:Carboxylic ester hydrolase n=1 Tax=Coprinopsis marcescibilis TaxID=230819 RepID=A0A5C3L3T6_COPMA|nr:carotenoid ester lipase precursor [Coprinopsis marcescibilis]